mgnify:CR=1 FL=1
MSRYYNEDTLAHFSIPGMKWGQRKNRYTRSDARLHRKIERYMDNTDLDTLTDKQKKNLAATYLYFEAKKQGVEVPKMHRDLKRSLNDQFSSRKEVVAKRAGLAAAGGAIAMVLGMHGQGHIRNKKDLATAVAGGAIVGGLIGAYTGNRIKDAQRENQENMPYVE